MNTLGTLLPKIKQVTSSVIDTLKDECYPEIIFKHFTYLYSIYWLPLCTFRDYFT